MNGGEITTQDQMDALADVFIAFCRQAELSSDGFRELLKIRFSGDWALIEVVARGEQQVTFETSNAVGRRYFIAILDGNWFLLPKPIDPSRFYALDMFDKITATSGGEVTPENVMSVTPVVLDKFAEGRWRARSSVKGVISNLAGASRPEDAGRVRRDNAVRPSPAAADDLAQAVSRLNGMMAVLQGDVQANTGKILSLLAGEEKRAAWLRAALERSADLQAEVLAELRKVRELAGRGWGPAAPGSVPPAPPPQAARAQDYERAGGENGGILPDAATPGERLSRTEYVGLVFTLFCHAHPGSFNPQLMQKLLSRQFKPLEFAGIYCERKARVTQFTDLPNSNAVLYWRFSLADKHFLLPCPTKKKTFRGVRGFDVFPADSSLNAETLQFCRPALLNRTEAGWQIEESGVLSTEWVRGWPNWRDFEYLVEAAEGTEAAEPAADREEKDMTPSPEQTPAESEPIPPDFQHDWASGAEAEKMPAESDPIAAVMPADSTPASDPLQATVISAFLDFCHTVDLESGDPFQDFCQQQKIIFEVLGLALEKVVCKQPGNELSAVFEQIEKFMRAEDFWVVFKKETGSTSGWLLPSMEAITNGRWRPAYSCVYDNYSPRDIIEIVPALVVRCADKPLTWAIKCQGIITASG